MKTIATMLSVALALAACGGCDEKEPSTGPFTIEFLSVEYDLTTESQAYGWYTLRMRIRGPNVAQELSLDRHGTHAQLVEFFDASGDQVDTHTGVRGESREMLMYPASVEGAAMVGDWTILASNLDGSFATSDNFGPTLGDGFEGRTPAGRVTHADMDKAIRWRVEARTDRVYLWIDGVEHSLPKP